MDKSKMDKFLHSSAFLRKNADEKEKIEYFLETPGNSEFSFFRKLLGKTPTQVRSMMIREFIRRFGLSARAGKIAEELPFRRSWRKLDAAIAAFGRTMEMEERRLFWDRMRYVLAALPQRKDYSDKYRDGHETNTPDEQWCRYTCKFCRRIVPRGSGLPGKTGLFCFAHDLPSTHSTYRKHSRLHPQLSTKQRAVAENLMKVIKSCPSGEEANKAVLARLIAPNECLPRLAAHLERAGHDGTPESLLWAFHGPASDEMDARYRDGLAEYIRHRLTARDPFDPEHPPLSLFGVDELSRAEAWLTLLDYDGRRKKV